MAEVYWDLEWTVQQQGFDYAYDKRLYDRLREGHARPVREHLYAGLDYQTRLARFLENHDEPRAATAFPDDMHQAAAIITFLSPGLRFFHQGEFEGRKKRISPHLWRGPDETVDPQLQAFYHRLLGVLREAVVREGRWQLAECAPAWDGNWTNDCFVAFAWQNDANDRLLAVSTIRPTKASATSTSRSKAWPIANGGSRTCFARQPTTATAPTCKPADSTSTLRRGEAPSSSLRFPRHAISIRSSLVRQDFLAARASSRDRAFARGP